VTYTEIYQAHKVRKHSIYLMENPKLDYYLRIPAETPIHYLRTSAGVPNFDGMRHAN
jgi:hypothetical protein